uniref:glycosyltransferase family 4 protein n=1 Tax=Algoriphagus sp. TaxID=1872435 RepID=UPI004048D025
MRKKKLLFITQYFYPENFKGNDLVFELVKRGFEVLVITGKPNYPKGSFYNGYGFFKRNFEEINGAKIYRIPIIPRGNGGGFRIAINYLSFYFSSLIFFKFFSKKFIYDLVLTQQLSPLTSSLPSIWYKKRSGKPLLTWVLDLWPESVVATTKFKNGFIVKKLENAAKNLYNQSDIILVSSKSFIIPIQKKDIAKNKIVYFPNWADEIFEIGNKDKQFSKLPSGFNVVFAGNFGEAQDFKNVINAIKLISITEGINFIFVGSGRFDLELRNLVNYNNLSNVFVYSHHSIDFMPSLYEQASAMLLTLKGGNDISNTVPAKLQTYMSCSKAILAMIDGESSDIIKNSNCGFVAKAGDFKTLAFNILKMKKLSISDLHKLEENSFNYYNLNFSRQNAMDKIENVINKLI